MSEPFKMKGMPFKRNFGIGDSESPDSTSPASKIDFGKIAKNMDLKKALAAGMDTLPGGHNAYNNKTKEYERGEDGKLIMGADGKPISKASEDTSKPYDVGRAFGDVKDFLGIKKKDATVEESDANVETEEDAG